MLARACPVLLGLFAVHAGRPGLARAESALPISVEREPGAEDCPDKAGLVARVRAILGRDSHPEGTPYQITFSRGPQTFTAAIRSDSEGGTVRYLNAREPNCSALAHATAIALAVLFDADLATTEPAEDKPAEAPTPAPAPVEPPPEKPGPRQNAKAAAPGEEASSSAGSAAGVRVDPLISVGAGALVGVLRPVGLALLADAGLEVESFRVSLGALWVVPETIALSPGSARETLTSGTARACYALSRRFMLRFDVCSGVLLGAATAEARGFTSNERHTELFLAFPAELSLSARSRFIGWQLGASALLLAPRNEFEVEGRGLTYRAPPVAGLLALRLLLEPLR
ncbi:MAG TPA: hypothetical protein VNW92_18295 [Polyangiaceae bacterium]|nr:hypothetical protein [Polyangiaceae bacterium]